MPSIAGRYELGPILGSGGFATVYRARDTEGDRDVAIKVFPALSADVASARERAAQLDRFGREARALSRLRSRYVAHVHDFGRDEAVGLYLVMDYVDGVPLDTRVLGRPLFAHDVLRVARGLLAGLAEAHAAGIVHCDVKPSNVLVPRGSEGLDEPRLIDFGIARDARRALLEGEPIPDDARGRVVLGTPAWMAPEQLRDASVGPPADVYAAGLVLFALFDVGPLFPAPTLRDQLRARILREPSLEGRIPMPIAGWLTRMLAPDPAQRFRDAHEALEAIADLETAPVSVSDLVALEAAAEGVTGDDDVTRKSGARLVGAEAMPFDDGSGEPSTVREGRESDPPRASEPSPARPSDPGAYGWRRLARLSSDPVVALVDALRALDLAMVDALARRERGEANGRIVRALTLALRLEIDAAAVLLEPVAAKSDLARAVGASLVHPRARAGMRARAFGARDEGWITTLDPELGAMLVATSLALATRDDAQRGEASCRRMLDRLGQGTSAAATTLHMARAYAAALSGAMAAGRAVAEMIRLRDDARPPPAFHALLRALLLGLASARTDDKLARDQLERAARLAADSGATLLEVRALVAWGGMLVEVPEAVERGRVEQGLRVLDRAATLLAHGDAPSLEHLAELHRGVALLVLGRYDEAAPRLRRAREAGRGELLPENAVLSSVHEAFAALCLGDRESAGRVVAELTDARIGAATPRTAAYAHLVRSVYAMLYQTPEVGRAELRRAHALAAAAEDDGDDAQLVAEVLAIVYAVARDEDVDLARRAAELGERVRTGRFVAFHWFDVLRAILGHVRDASVRARIADAVEHIAAAVMPLATPSQQTVRDAQPVR